MDVFLPNCFRTACTLLFIFQLTSHADEGLEFFEARIRPVLVEHCYECHSGDAKKLKGGLLLEYREQILKGGDSGPAIVPKDPAKSLLIQALKWESFEMPPKRKLPARVIKDFERWVAMGAPWPTSTKKPVIKSGANYDWKVLRKKHWSFQPVQHPSVPVIKSDWPRNAIDHFVLRKLNQGKLKPARAARPDVLIRRMYFDVVGLPPQPERVASFVNDYERNADKAVAKLVSELLSSPQFGERWARHWLDVARYSDGFGASQEGAAMPNAWRYRDWVVKSINNDLDFATFIKLQVAGDLVKDRPTPEATGFVALGPTYTSDGGDPDSIAQAKSETLDDRMDTVTRGLLGITASCSRCHDHKFDPISQLDYYSVAGVFNNTATHLAPLVPAAVVKRFNDHQHEIKSRTNRINAINKKVKQEKRKPAEKEESEIKKLQAEINELKKTAPPQFPVAHALRENGAGNMKVAIRGNLRRTGDEAPRRFFRILAGAKSPLYKQGSGRLELAESIVSPNNPLTSRVFANRVWMHHFGAALVRTPSNFGKLGEQPTHPELLDWMASHLISNGSIKELHRFILTSSAYRMSSAFDAQAFEQDGDNRLLWRMNPRRLDVESWRDALLSVTGELDLAMGGPPTEQISSRRRTIYFKVSRLGDRFATDRLLRMFDFPLMRATVAQRSVSIVPQQYLFMLNSPFMAERSKALARRLEREAGSVTERIQLAYRLLYARAPGKEDLALGARFFAGAPKDPSKLEKYCQVLLSSNEFFYIQ